MQTVIIADDHPLLLQSLLAVLEDMQDIEVICTETNGLEAQKKILLLSPDLVILDVDMPGLNGISILENIRRERFQGKVMMFSQYGEKDLIAAVKKKKANGYLLKTATPKEIKQSINAILSGKDVFAETADRKPFSDSKTFVNLTEREKQILHFIGDGLTNKEISEQIFLSPKTIEVHRSNLMRKLEVTKVSLLIKKAMQIGLIS